MKNPVELWAGSFVLGLTIIFAFRLFAEQEVLFSNLFFTAKTCSDDTIQKIRCGQFEIVLSESWRLVRAIGLRLPQMFALILALWLLFILFFKSDKSPIEILRPLHGLLSMLLGPVLLTNLIMKPLWGRPRPVQTIEFNGDVPYVLPGDISDHCVGNCSFVSGEATAAFWMLWIVPFLPPPWRMPISVLIFILACMISLLRVAFGGHFLSDVVVGGVVAIFAIYLSAWILQTKSLRRGIELWNDFSNQNSFGSKPNKAN